MINLTQEKIYEEYSEKVFGYIISKVQNQSVAEDLTSCVFVKVAERIKTFDSSKASLSTWIYTVTRNTVIDYYRTNKQTVELGDILDEKNIEDDFINAENLKNLKEGLKSLERLELKVIVLRFYSEKTLKDISSETGYSYSYIKVVEKNAINKLKKFLEKE